MSYDVEELIEEFKVLDNMLSEGELTEDDEDRWVLLKHRIEQLTIPGSTPSSRDAPLVAHVDLEVSFGDARGFKQSYLRHISEGGVYVEMNPVLEMGTRFRLGIRVDSPPASLELDVEVVWVNATPSEESGLKPGVGVAWLDLPKDKKALIKSIVHGALDEIVKSSRRGAAPT